MKKYCFLIFLSFFFGLNAWAQVNYSPLYFGPNALPVPEFTMAKVPNKTEISLAGDYYFGFGDRTKNLFVAIEIPLLRERVSLKVWSTHLEYYQTNDEVSAERNTWLSNTSGRANGDIYVQTRMLVCVEKTFRPAIVLNFTLRTASGTDFQNRRYFDTPGYHFDVEIAKHISVDLSGLQKIGLAADFGFLCWETTNSVQNDAVMWGLKLSFVHRLFDFEHTFSGYSGWMDNGDKPQVYDAKLFTKRKKLNFFGQYQYGIRDFPYHHFRIGLRMNFESLTPKYLLSGAHSEL